MSTAPHSGSATPQMYQDALDRAARYYREALKEIIGECSHDEPRIERIRERAESGIRAADYELAQVAPPEGATAPTPDPRLIVRKSADGAALEGDTPR